MKLGICKWIAGAGALMLAFAALPSAYALCGMPNRPKPSAWQPGAAGMPQWVPVSEDEREPSIVGMWHVVFTGYTSNGESVPAGIPVDNAVVVWHPDGTEIMNSSRSAQDGNFCLGVWKHTGPCTYLLNHIPWQGNVFDPTVPPDTVGAPQDGVQLIEKVTLSPDGNSYTGTFSLTAYQNGSVYQTFTGTLAGKRITPETPFSSLL